MRFSKDYSKLDKQIFTTIRKNTSHYRLMRKCKVHTPTSLFTAYLIKLRRLKKEQITEKLAQSDADCSRTELIAMLEKWYGKEFDDFLLLTFKREGDWR